LTSSVGFTHGKIVERFACHEPASPKAGLFKQMGVEGVNFFARRTIER
jgi:hypothetical protein